MLNGGNSGLVVKAMWIYMYVRMSVLTEREVDKDNLYACPCAVPLGVVP